MAKLTNDQAADRLVTLVVEAYFDGQMTDKELKQLKDWLERAWERGRDK